MRLRFRPVYRPLYRAILHESPTLLLLVVVTSKINGNVSRIDSARLMNGTLCTPTGNRGNWRAWQARRLDRPHWPSPAVRHRSLRPVPSQLLIHALSWSVGRRLCGGLQRSKLLMSELCSSSQA